MKETRFGQKVERLQAEQGLSNKALAVKLGVTPARVSYLKATTKPHPTTIYKLCKVFDVDAAIFFDDVR